MVIDFKYHIITVIVLFISLAIGILIGSSMVGDEVIIQEQHKIISNLEEDFNSLRRENRKFASKIRDLNIRLEESKEFQEMILPVVVKGQLEDKDILLFVGDNIAKGLKEELVKTLKLADIGTLKIADDKVKICDFDRVLFLGEVKQEIKDKYSEKIIKVEPKNLQLTSGLIKFVLQLAANDLKGEPNE